jgi:PAS domain S-box-containing protein
MSTNNTDYLFSTDLTTNLMELLPEGLIVLDSTNCIEFANEAILKLLEFTGKQLSGKHISELFVNPDEGNLFITKLEENARIQNVENRFLTSGKRILTASYSGTVVPRTEKSETRKLIVLRDVTNHRYVEERLASANKALEKNNKELDQFAYIVSHDLKAPLRAISNLSLWLQEDLGPSLADENKKNLDMLRGRVLRMESLINGILEYSKLGREQIQTERIDLFKLLNEVIESIGPPPHFKVILDQPLPVLEAPRIMLIQIFSNLISNAIKYHDKKEGMIRIYSVEKPTEYQITVEDNGPGIPEEFCEKIFVIFQTLQSKDKFESTGIGLAIVKRIVEERGCKIWVESEVGKGSKFIFTWPKQEVNNS